MAYVRMTTSNNTTLLTRGFTLLEVTMVIGIIALIIAMGVSGMQGMVDAAHNVSTQEKMKAVDDALLAYWKMNNRLPCPASGTLADTNANYGIEGANNNSTCTGGTPAANKILNSNYQVMVEGMVPFVTLGLPESYAYDAWGGRIAYSTSPRLTDDEAAFQHRASSKCRFVELTPYSDNGQHPAYVLVSHGENGFGARNTAGTVLLPAGASTVDGYNAHYDPSTYGVTTYDGKYYTTYNDPNSDDIVSFKTIRDLYDGQTEHQGMLQDRSILFFSFSSSPYIYHYYWDGDSFITQSNFASMPAGTVQGKIAASTDNMNCHHHIFYSKSGGSSFANCQFRQYNGTYFGSDCTPSSHTGTGFNASAHYPNPSGATMGEVVYAYATSPYLHYVTMANLAGTTLTSYGTGSANEPDTAPAGVPQSVEYSPVTGHLAVAHASSPYISLYNRSSATGFAREKMSDPSSLPTGDATDVAYSLDGNYLAVSHATSPYVTIYKVNGTTYSKIQNPDTLPTGNANAVSFSANSKYLAVAHETSPYISVYKLNEDYGQFTKLDDPSTLPTGTGRDVDFAATGGVFAVALEATVGNRPLILYNVEHGEVVTKMSDPNVAPATGTTGYAVEFMDAPAIARPNNAYITNGLVGWWKFEEGTGTSAADSSSQGKTGTLTGTPSWSTTVPNALGSLNTGSLDFDGSADYVDIGSVSFGLTDTLTISLWVNLDTITSDRTFISQGGYIAGGWLFQREGTGNKLRFAFGGASSYDGTATFTTTGSWVHLAAVVSSGTPTAFYVDGASQTPTGSGTLSISEPKDFEIGRRTDTTAQYIDGKIDDVRIYNRALSADEITQIYNGGG